VNYENVRNIPIQLFDGRIVEKKKIEIETKLVHSTIIRKEKKELLDEDNNDFGESVDTSENETKESERQYTPIKINYVDSISTSPRFRRTQTSTQNGSLSSSIPSLTEIPRKTRDPKKSLVDPSTPRRQQTLNEIQNDLEDAQKKLATHLQQIGSTSGTTLSSRNRQIGTRSRSVETSSKRNGIKKAEQEAMKKEESSPDLDKYMEVWENISRDLDDIIKKANIDTRTSEATRAKSVPIHGRETMKMNKIAGEEAGIVDNSKENIYLTEIPGQQTKQDIKKDMTTSTDNLENKTTGFKGAKGLRNMLQTQSQENIKNGSEFSPEPPKRDIRSGFSVKEDRKNNLTTSKKASTREDGVTLNTDAACFACDACTQTGGEGREKGCNLM